MENISTASKTVAKIQLELSKAIANVKGLVPRVGYIQTVANFFVFSSGVLLLVHYSSFTTFSVFPLMYILFLG